MLWPNFEISIEADRWGEAGLRVGPEHDAQGQRVQWVSKDTVQILLLDGVTWRELGKDDLLPWQKESFINYAQYAINIPDDVVKQEQCWRCDRT